MADVSREEIERLVRRVLALVLAAPASPTPAFAAPASPALAKELVSPTSTKQTLQLDERVISLRSLEGKLEGIKQLVVQRGAVVTPAARDELKHRSIAIERGASGEKGTTASKSGNPLVLAATNSIDPQAHVAALGEGCAVEIAASGELSATIGKWADRVLVRKAPGVIVTEEPAAALILANRNFGIRAILATSPREVQAAAAAIGANGLVVDPRGRGRFELISIVRAFAAAGWRNPPEALRKALNGVG